MEVEKRKSFFSMANVKSQIAGLIPTTKDDIWKQVILLQNLPEPVFLNVYGAPESILRNEFRQPM